MEEARNIRLVWLPLKEGTLQSLAPSGYFGSLPTEDSIISVFAFAIFACFLDVRKGTSRQYKVFDSWKLNPPPKNPSPAW